MKTLPLKIVFAGTPDFAAAHLERLIQSKHHICAVYTQPDRPAGRGRKLTASPVKTMALANDLMVYQPETLKTPDARAMLRAFEADIMVVVAYGIILPEEILQIPTLGCINVHASLLPRWRGAAPIQRAIEAGDEQTGVTIMQMDVGLDTGDMLLTSQLTISDSETSSSLHDRLQALGTEALISALDKIAKGSVKAVKQSDASCYAAKLTKAEAAIDWNLDAVQIDRKMRAFTPWPGSFVSLKDQKLKVIGTIVQDQRDVDLAVEQPEQTGPGTIISVNEAGIRVACARGDILITSLQMPGKKMTEVSALLNAYRDKFQVGTHFEL